MLSPISIIGWKAHNIFIRSMTWLVVLLVYFQGGICSPSSYNPAKNIYFKFSLCSLSHSMLDNRVRCMHMYIHKSSLLERVTGNMV